VQRCQSLPQSCPPIPLAGQAPPSRTLPP
jgi:hypothetical protein